MSDLILGYINNYYYFFVANISSSDMITLLELFWYTKNYSDLNLLVDYFLLKSQETF